MSLRIPWAVSVTGGSSPIKLELPRQQKLLMEPSPTAPSSQRPSMGPSEGVVEAPPTRPRDNALGCCHQGGSSFLTDSGPLPTRDRVGALAFSHGLIQALSLSRLLQYLRMALAPSPHLLLSPCNFNSLFLFLVLWEFPLVQNSVRHLDMCANPHFPARQ